MAYSALMTDKKSEQICIKIDPNMYKKLKECADMEERSMGFLVRKMIDEGLIKRGHAASLPPKKTVAR